MRKKLFAYFMLILFFGVVITGYLSYRLTKRLIFINITTDLKSDSILIEEYIKNSGENPDYNGIAKALKKRIDKRITIIEDNGKILGESDNQSSDMENHAKRPEFIEALSKGEGTSIRYSDTEKNTMLYYAYKFTYKNDINIIRLSVKFDAVQNMQFNYLKFMVIAMIFGIIICTVLAYLYIDRFTQPIRMLTRAATTIALGRYEKRINIHSKDEIGQLGHAFDMMAGRLQETIQNLSDKQNKLFSILTSMDDGVIVVDNNEKIILINPAAKKFFGIEGNITGKYFIELIRNYDIQDIIKTFPDDEIEVSLNHPIPKLLKIKATKVINYNNNEGNIGVMLFIRDITKLRKFENMRSDFVANVSHELRSPLTSIKGFAETLKYVEEKETRDKFLDIIYVETERLTRLINDILTLSELENKDFSVNFEKINLKLSIQEVIYIMEPSARGKNIDINFIFDDDTCSIYGDRDKLKQMMINLIDNGIKYSNDNGKVEISVFREDKRVFIRVHDNGVGIPKENISRLFERFYRVDKGRSRKMGGTGLGLAIVKHIIKIFGGNIEVTSKVGEGTTFIIDFPSAD